MKERKEAVKAYFARCIARANDEALFRKPAYLMAAFVFSAVAALADETSGVDTLFNAVDVSGISGNVSTLLLSFIGIAVIFVGYRYIRKVLGR